MMKLRIRWICAVGGAIAVGGCAAAPKETGYRDVQNLVLERTGHVVQWRGHGASDEAVDSAIDAMLRDELSADKAVQAALLNNPALQATLEDVGIAEADLVQAGLLRNPIFAASWRFPDRSPRGLNAEYAVSQDFLDLLVIPLRKKLAAQELERTKREVAHQVLQLEAEVKTAFYTLQARQQLAARLRLIVNVNQTAAELAERQHEAGTINELGLANQRALYEQSRAEAAQAEAQVSVDRERLNRLLGLGGDRTQWTTSPQLPPLPDREVESSQLESIALRQRLDIAAARAEVDSLKQAADWTRRYRYTAGLDVGVDTERDPGGQRVTGPTLSLQLPLFDQGQARIARIEAQIRQSQRRLQSMEINARSEVREAHDRVVAQRGLVQFNRTLLAERVRILELVLQQYNGMLKGPYDLLLAKQTEVDAERSSVEAWRDYWIARADLERAVGGRVPSCSAEITQPATAATQPATMKQPEGVQP